jgi:hypothetical protein
MMHTTGMREWFEYKEEVVTRNLSKELPNSELRLKRYEYLKFCGNIVILGSSRGIYGNIESWEGFCVKIHGHKFNLDEVDGLDVKWLDDTKFYSELETRLKMLNKTGA